MSPSFSKNAFLYKSARESRDIRQKQFKIPSNKSLASQNQNKEDSNPKKEFEDALSDPNGGEQENQNSSSHRPHHNVEESKVES